MDFTTEFTWTPPQYSFSCQPRLHANLQVIDGLQSANFVRAARWSPDGSTVLAHCEDHSFRLLTPDISSQVSPDAFAGTTRSLPQPAPILDFMWYPTACTRDPASYCFVASVRECPVKLLDASDGRLRASYPIVDHRERQIAPHCMAFNPTMNKLYCGFEDAIEVFDVHRPGQEGTRLPMTPSKKSRDGLKGIISAIAFAPTFDYSSSDIYYAAGSLTPTASNIALFSETQDAVPLCYLSTDATKTGTSNNSRPLRAGVTQLTFNPMKPHILYASFRRHGCIYAWDLRGTVDAPVARYDIDSSVQVDDPGDGLSNRWKPLTRTNQKLKFDIDITGRWLGVGDQNGEIMIFDLRNNSSTEETTFRPTLTLYGHDDAIGSVTFHPLEPLALSVSGSRHFEGYNSSSSSDSESGNENPTQRIDPRLKFSKRYPVVRDNSVKLWRCDQKS